jgi:hypothetical protein
MYSAEQVSRARHLQLSDTGFSAFHNIDAIWLFWQPLYGFVVQSKELGEWDMQKSQVALWIAHRHLAHHT